MMYKPDYSKSKNNELAFDLIQENPLGLIISNQNGTFETSYIPFIASEDKKCLLGHLARANPHWKSLNGNKMLISFRGVDRYVSPSYYEEKLNVPTWNYAVVEIEGVGEIVDTYEGIESILDKSVKHFEKRNNTNWQYDLPEKFRAGLVKGIVGIRISIDLISAKYKLSQNRESVDYKTMTKFLETSSADSDQEMLRWMKKF